MPTYSEAAIRGAIKTGVLKNIVKFAGKHICQSLFFNKVASNSIKKKTLAHVFSCEFCKILQNTSGRLLLHISFEISKCNGFSKTFGNFIYFLFEFFLVVWNFKFFSLFSLPSEENCGKLAFWKSICYNPVSIFITQFVESFCCNWLF